MTAYPAWTPAPRPGIIPLHPLTFGTILGRSFAVLRHNPKVLLGFAIGLQAVLFLLILAGTGGISFAAFSRLDTLTPGTDDFEAVLAGSTAITVGAGVVLGLIGVAVQVLVQAVVVAEVAHASVAEKLRLGALWQRVKPVIGRLIGYALLLSLVVLVAIGLLVVGIIALGANLGVGAAIGLSVLLVLGSIPLFLWLTVKLLLVPSVLVLEQTTIRRAIARSWGLVVGRFWPALGVTVLIWFIFGAIAQTVSLPATFLLSATTSIFAPTGDPTAGLGASLIILVVTYLITFLVQAVQLVVMSTASALIYVDCRMRKEGLDLELLSYVERRDAGETALGDPWAYVPGSAATTDPRARAGAYAQYPAQYPASQQGYPQPGYPPQAYPQQGYATPGYPQQWQGHPGQQPAYPAQPPAYPTQTPGNPPPSAAQPEDEGSADPAPGQARPDSTQWSAPGHGGSDAR